MGYNHERRYELSLKWKGERNRASLFFNDYQNLTQGKYFKELALESGTVTFQDSNIRGNASVIRYGRLAILTLAIAYATDLSPGVDYFFGASSILPVASIMITGNTTLGIAYNGYITTEGIVVIRFATNIFKASDEIHFSVPFYS